MTVNSNHAAEAPIIHTLRVVNLRSSRFQNFVPIPRLGWTPERGWRVIHFLPPHVFAFVIAEPERREIVQNQLALEVSECMCRGGWMMKEGGKSLCFSARKIWLASKCQFCSVGLKLKAMNHRCCRVHSSRRQRGSDSRSQRPKIFAFLVIVINILPFFRNKVTKGGLWKTENCWIATRGCMNHFWTFTEIDLTGLGGFSNESGEYQSIDRLHRYSIQWLLIDLYYKQGHVADRAV